MSTDISLPDVCNIGVLVSHRGSNLQAIIDACESGTLKAKPTIVISNNSQSGGLERARLAGIASLHLSSKTHPEPDLLDSAITAALKEHQVNLVVTAGYMKKLGPITLQAFRGKIINIHPSLLPKHGGKFMFGLNVHQAVLDAQETETGITVHHVDGEYDTGQIIAQTRLPVFTHDTAESLADRVIIREHELLIDTLKGITG